MKDTRLTVVKKCNGDFNIHCPFESGFVNVPVVVLQKNGEIRWASLGPMPSSDVALFRQALDLALEYAGGDFEGEAPECMAGVVAGAKQCSLT